MHQFPLLERAIGTSGKLTALDYSAEMYVYNADVEKDLVRDLERAFDDVAVDEFNGGSLFIAAARKAAGPAGAGSA